MAEHRLLRGRHQWSMNPAHYAGLPAAGSLSPRKHLAFQFMTDPEDPSAWGAAPEVEQRPLSVYAQLLEECQFQNDLDIKKLPLK